MRRCRHRCVRSDNRPVGVSCGSDDDGGLAGDSACGEAANGAGNVFEVDGYIIAMFVAQASFERHPDLRIACTEAEADWIPHFIYRSDHAVQPECGAMSYKRLSKMPSEVC